MSEESAPKEKTHPLRKWWVWVTGLLAIVVVGLIVAVLVYNYRAKQAYEEHLAFLATIGESVSLDQFQPVDIPAQGDNFAEARIIKVMSSPIELLDGEGYDLKLATNQLDFRKVPGFNPDFFRTDTRRIRYLRPEPIRHYYRGETESEASEQILTHCEDYAEVILEFEEAVARPYSFFSPDHPENFDSYDTDLFVDGYPLGPCASLLFYRARSSLLNGDPDIAARDAVCLIRLAKHLSQHPQLPSHFLSSNIADQAGIIVHQGLATNAWNVSHLDRFIDEWTDLDLEVSNLRALRGDRASFVQFTVNQKGIPYTKFWHVNDSNKTLHQWLSRLPSGVFFESATAASEIVQNELLSDDKGNPLFDSVRTNPDIENTVRSLRNSVFNNFRYVSTGHLQIGYGTFWMKSLRSQIHFDQVRIALELEKIHIATGCYPAKLPATPGLPLTDRISGESLIYALLPDETYHLYSVGPDGFDDGGRIRHRLEDGDWVWRLHLPDDFDYDEYRGR